MGKQDSKSKSSVSYEPIFARYSKTIEQNPFLPIIYSKAQE